MYYVEYFHLFFHIFEKLLLNLELSNSNIEKIIIYIENEKYDNLLIK